MPPITPSTTPGATQSLRATLVHVSNKYRLWVADDLRCSFPASFGLLRDRLDSDVSRRILKELGCRLPIFLGGVGIKRRQPSVRPFNDTREIREARLVASRPHRDPNEEVGVRQPFVERVPKLTMQLGLVGMERFQWHARTMPGGSRTRRPGTRTLSFASLECSRFLLRELGTPCSMRCGSGPDGVSPRAGVVAQRALLARVASSSSRTRPCARARVGRREVSFRKPGLGSCGVLWRVEGAVGAAVV
jgi:hypothetical protein